MDALQAIVDVVPTPMFVVNRQHIVVLVNKAAEDFINKPAGKMIGKTYFDFLSYSEAQAGTLVDEQTFLTGEPDEREERVVNGEGELRYLLTRRHLIHDANGMPLLVGITSDVTAYRQAEERNLYLSLHDVLTGLPNRALLRDRLEQAMARLSRQPGLCALLYVDLDHFKAVNDNFGHQAGDDVIREFAARATAQLRSSDTMARLGGDEFAILLTDLNEPGEAMDVANRVLEVATRHFDVAGGQPTIGASIGVVLISEPLQDGDEAHRRADVALYRAKDGGRACIKVFDEEMDAEERWQRRIELELIEALRTGEGLAVHYQPLMSKAADAVIGMEALFRWTHRELGEIPTERAISVAEDSGLIVPLGDWVLADACRTLAPYRDVSIAVNVSPVQLQDPGFPDRVAALLKASKIAPQRLQLELTETAVIKGCETVGNTLRRLRAMGVKIALDDFGTGYSSLSHLHKYEVDKIKIDRSFIEMVGRSENSTAIVRAVSRIGQSLGMDITAEGVETNEQWEFLLGTGCTEMQGFLFSKALPAAEAVRFIERSRRGKSRARKVA